MSLVSFKDLMAEAEKGQYAVGYFESWNSESLLAVADAAEATRSPIILGFSGIQLADPLRVGSTLRMTCFEAIRGYAAFLLKL